MMVENKVLVWNMNPNIFLFCKRKFIKTCGFYKGIVGEHCSQLMKGRPSSYNKEELSVLSLIHPVAFAIATKVYYLYVLWTLRLQKIKYPNSLRYCSLKKEKDEFCTFQINHNWFTMVAWSNIPVNLNFIMIPVIKHLLHLCLWTIRLQKMKCSLKVWKETLDLSKRPALMTTLEMSGTHFI